MGSGDDLRLPLSNAQRGVWFAHQQDPARNRYTCAEHLTIEGPLQHGPLREAWAALCADAVSLRVRRVEHTTDGELFQVLEAGGPPLEDLDLRTAADPAAAALSWMYDDLDAPLDLAAGPVSRACLLRVAEHRHLLYLRMHHLVTDGHSMPLLQGTLANGYTRRTGGESTGSPALGDLGALLRKDAAYRASDDFTRDGEYWQGRFADHPEPVRVPALPPVGSRPLRLRETTELPAADVRRLAGTAAGLGTTWQLALIAATAAYLQRATGRRDVVLGLTSNGRRGIAAQRTPGMAANTLALRLDVSPAATLRGLLPAVVAEVGDVQRHERYRYDDLCRALGTPSAQDGPLGPILNLMPYARRFGFGAATASATNLASGPSIDLSYSVTGSTEQGLTVSVDANPARHRAEDVAAALHRWSGFVRAVIAEPDRELRTIDLRTDEERAARPEDTTRQRDGRSVVDLVHEVARRQPDALALSGRGTRLSYAELDARAARLAATLRRNGVGAEDIVGLAMPRSPGLIVAMLAVLRAGGCYLPLDLTYPPDRLRYMATDSALRCVVVAEPGAVSGMLPAGVTVVQAGSGELTPAAEPAAPDALDPDAAANIIYTSGSTGRPKGAVASHRALANLALDHLDRFGLGPHSTVLQYVSPAFDAAGGDIWPALAAGAHLVLPVEATGISPDELVELLRAQRVTHVALPPNMLRRLPDTELPDLACVVVGGEPTEPGLVERWAPGRRLINMYGPTEGCCASTGSQTVVGRPVHIGTAIDNVVAHVLDDELQPVGVGMPGELYIEGVNLARGYLNQPARTAERFLPCPSGPAGARMYRTGDRVHRDADGALHYLGRTDHQVKVRGFRIEPGEIETALAAEPGVHAAVVLIRRAPSGATQLVGYVVARPGETVLPQALREGVLGTLPEYMVPASIVVLEKFPLQANGKVDRAALPDPARPAGTQPPATPEQQALCGIFADILGVPGIGVHDSFFGLGGDSILALRLVSLARGAGLVLTVPQVFEHPTVAGLAGVAAREQADAAVTDPGTGSWPAPPIVHWALDLGPIDAFHQAVTIRVPAGAGHDRLAKTLGTVVDRHPALRATLGTDRTLHAAEPDGDVHDRLSTVDATGLDEDAVAELVARQRDAAVGELSVSGGTLLRAVWLDAGSNTPGTLLLVLHHLAVDGVSWRILLDDLAAAWASVAHDAPARLAASGTSYRAWASSLAGAAAEAPVADQAAYWRTVLGTPDPRVGSRPLDPGVDTFATARTAGFTVPPETTAALLNTLPERYRATQTDILLTGLALAVRRWRPSPAGGTALLVDLEGHGRHSAPGQAEHAALENTVGWFTSIHPVAVDPGGVPWSTVTSGGAGLAAALKQVKENLHAVPEHGLGFGMLRYLNPGTADQLAAAGTPQVAVNYLGRLAVPDDTDWSLTGAEPFSGSADPRMAMPHPLQLDAIAYDRPGGTELTVRAMWPSGVLDDAAVAELFDAARAALTGLAAHARRPDAGGLTPSDLPLLSLDQDDIDALTAHRPAATDILPLTPLQEGLLLHHLLNPDGVDVYNDQLRLEIDGPLDVPRMRTALDVVLRRHPNLGAAFDHEVADPVQILGPARASWSEHDLSAVPGAEGELRVAKLAAAERAARFDLADPPALRVQVIRLGTRRHLLVLTAHHIVWDGWSIAVVLREMFACYGSGDDRALPPAPRYRDYLTWLAGQDRAGARAAWAGYLAGLAGPTHVSPDQPGGDHVIHELLTAHLPGEVSAALTDRARQLGVTLNNVVQLVWGTLLHTLTGDDDVVFGTSVSGRPPELPGVDRLVGLITNTIPVRVRLDPAAGISDTLTALYREQVPLLAHHHLGLADIQRQSGHDRVTLFDTTVMVLNYPFEPDAWNSALGDLRVLEHQLSDDTPYPLRLVVLPGPEVGLRFGYRPDVVGHDEAAALFRRVVEAFTAVARRPDLTVSDLVASTAHASAPAEPSAGRPLEGTT